MFVRMNKITAVKREIDRLLTHKAWKAFGGFFDRESVDLFFAKRGATSENPFQQEPFDAAKEARLFLEEQMHTFCEIAERSTGYKRDSYRYAAEELARVLCVPMPRPKKLNATPHDAGLQQALKPQLRIAARAGYETSPGAPTTATALLPGPWDAESSDERKLAAMERLINDPSAPMGERAAAQAAYARLRRKRRGF